MKLDFNLYEPAFGHWQQCGVVGLKLAIAQITNTDNPYKFATVENGYKLSVCWEGDNIDAWDWLIKATFKLNNGLIDMPCSDEYCHLAMIETILSIPKTRPTGGRLDLILFENEIGKISRSTLALTSYVHQGFAKKLWTKKRFEIPCWLMPNSVVDPKFTIDIKGAIACLFAPLMTCFYEISFEKKALLMPIFGDLSIPQVNKPVLVDYFAYSLHDAAGKTLLLNRHLIGVEGYLYEKKQANRPPIVKERVEVFSASIDFGLLETAYDKLPNMVIITDKHPPFIHVSEIRGITVENIIKGYPLYSGLQRIKGKTYGYEKHGIRNIFFEVKAIKTVDEPIVDDCDRAYLQKYRWSKGKDCGWFRRWRINGKQKIVYLHREILGISGNQQFQVLFRDGNKSNCRRDNLELLTMSEHSKRNSNR